MMAEDLSARSESYIEATRGLTALARRDVVMFTSASSAGGRITVVRGKLRPPRWPRGYGEWRVGDTLLDIRNLTAPVVVDDWGVHINVTESVELVVASAEDYEWLPTAKS
jgi:hypothetical protein